MRLSSLLLTSAPFAIAAVLSLAAASGVATLVEDTTELTVRRSLDDNGLSWAEVEAQGLEVILTGTAPSEALRFRAKSVAGTQVDAARVVDEMTVAAGEALEAPRFSIEILRNESGISLIGLVPADMDRSVLLGRVKSIAAGADVSDLLQTADYTPPSGWDRSVDFALDALREAPRSKISIAADTITVRAMTESLDAKQKLERSLTREAGPNLQVVMDISAPRPVITPFTLRVVVENGVARFDACSAEDEAASARILAAATKAGLTGEARCQLGLGVPSPRWAEAAEKAIAALHEIGNGSVTFADGDIALNAAQGSDPATFDRVVGELENSLPDLFSLKSHLPEPPSEEEAELATEFVATLSPEGQVQLRGRLTNELSRTATESYARAMFGSGSVHNAARLDDDLPGNWPLRVLTGLSALSQLSNGVVVVSPDTITVSGNTGSKDASDKIAGLLASKLSEATQFDIDVTYLETLDPVAQIPQPEECVGAVQDILKTQKITFEPGSDAPDGAALPVLDAIATSLQECPDLRIEISGHTDSQGSEGMNQALSQARAQAVLNALRERRLLTATYRAVGYGETKPIASNDSEKGREANRRIEFKLITTALANDAETNDASVTPEAQEGSDQ